jgi:hypothetical protein
VPHGLPPARPRPWPRNTPRRQEQPRLTRTRPTRSRPPRRRPARATDGVRTKPASIDFYETRTGQCRILPPLTHRVAEACNSWRKAIAPVSEHVAHLVADYTATTISRRTPLTQANLARARERIAAASEERAGCSTTEPEVRKGNEQRGSQGSMREVRQCEYSPERRPVLVVRNVEEHPCQRQVKADLLRGMAESAGTSRGQFHVPSTRGTSEP